MKSTLTVLLFLGAIDLTKAIKLSEQPHNIVQTGTINENDIKWDNTNLQTSDVFDYDYEYTHKPSKMSEGRAQVNQFDGLIHSAGRAFDPTSGEKVDFDDSSLLDQEKFGGEPIALLQQKLDLQWHGQDVDLMDNEEVYDEQLDRFYESQQRMAEKPAQEVNQFDGMIHTQTGRIFDPTNGEEVETEWYDLQTETNDWYDEEVVRQANTDHVNQFDGLIHTFDGRMFSPVNGKEVVNYDSSYIQTGDIFDEDLENRQVEQAEKVNQWDGMIHAQTGKIIDPQTGRDVTSQYTEENEFAQLNSNDWYDQDFEENPAKLNVKMEGSTASLDPFTGRVNKF